MDAQTVFEGLIEQLSVDHPVEPQKSFGKTGLLVNRKAFAVLEDTGIVLRLPEAAQARALALEGAALWKPFASKGPMKGWILVPAKHADAIQDLARVALEAVL